MLIVQNSRRTPVTAMVIAGIVVVSAVVVWMATSTPDAPDLPAPAVTPAAAPAAPKPAARVVMPGMPVAAPPAAAPPEDPARVFDLGIAGGLLIDPSTVTALDRLQSMLGENPSPEDLARLERQLREGLPREDAEKAIQLFQGYRSYSQTMRTEVMAMGVPQNRQEADALMSRITQAQNTSFDRAAADAMFADQNRLSRVVLDAALVQNDASLNNDQKKAQLDALRARLPENQRHVVPELTPPPTEGASAPG